MIRQQTSSSRLKSITEHRSPNVQLNFKVPAPVLLQPGKPSTFRLSSIEGTISQPKAIPTRRVLKFRRPNNFTNPLNHRDKLTLNDCLIKQKRKSSHDIYTSRVFGPKDILKSRFRQMDLDEQIVFLKNEVLDFFIGNRYFKKHVFKRILGDFQCKERGEDESVLPAIKIS